MFESEQIFRWWAHKKCYVQMFSMAYCGKRTPATGLTGKGFSVGWQT